MAAGILRLQQIAAGLNSRTARVTSIPELTPEMSYSSLARRVSRYLQQTGWRMDEPWHCGNLVLRGFKNGNFLSLLIMDSKMPTWVTTVRDAQRLAFEINDVIGIFSATRPPGEALTLTREHAMFILQRNDLANVEEMLLAAKKLRADRVQKDDEGSEVGS